ncbi:MAG TPA: EAL domain-containing protein [Rhodospirillaceae bacterium]|nr:EAL domain-containing protein [Rhodospirillaceae bacterium]
MERGLTSAALKNDGLVSAAVRADIDTQRRIGDSAFREALTELRDAPELKGAWAVVVDAERSFSDVEQLRIRLDQDLEKGKALRSAETIDSVIPSLTALIEKTALLRLTYETVKRAPSNQLALLSSLRDHAAVMAEYAGRERALLTSLIMDHAKLNGPALQAISDARDHVGVSWNAISVVCARPDTPEDLVRAINGVRNKYFGDYETLRKAVLAAGPEGPYPVDALQFFEQATVGVGAILQLAQKTSEVADSFAAVEVRDSTAGTVISTFVLLSAGGLAGVALWISVRHIVRPILGITSAMERLAGGDRTVDVPSLGMNGEIGQMAEAVKVFKENAIRIDRMTETELRLAAAALEAHEGLVITDAEGVILRVNHAFCESSGYSAEEIVGKTPRILKSGRQDTAFYAELWGTLLRTGSWQGEIWNRRKNGEIHPKWLKIKAVYGADGAITHFVASHIDITERKATERKIKDLAFYDPLTGLPNRRLLMDRLQQAFASKSRDGRERALLFVDLDHFKTLNDTLGHSKGDVLLQAVGQRLSACLRNADTVARLGGDEFVVLLETLSESPDEAAAQAGAIGEKLRHVLGKPYQLADLEFNITPSIGIALFGNDCDGPDELLKNADIALYQAKAVGRNTVCFFDPDLQAASQARNALEKDLRLGLKSDQLFLLYQPQVEMGEVIGAEALIRWRHPERGIVSPAEFIPLAEETGLILQMGQWVLTTVCQQLAQWAHRPEMASLTVAVNVSACEVRQPEFVNDVLAAIHRAEADPNKIKLELTETMLVNDVEEIIAKMNALQNHGVRFSLDDFGTGYSSLSYLKRLPLSQLKIDRSFVTDVSTNSHDAAIAKTIVALGQTLGLKVIAEGVETEGQRQLLASYGCHTYQGYLFSRPVPKEALEDIMRQGEPVSA